MNEETNVKEVHLSAQDQKAPEWQNWSYTTAAYMVMWLETVTGAHLTSWFYLRLKYKPIIYNRYTNKKAKEIQTQR